MANVPMTLTPEQTALVVRTLAERVMGWRMLGPNDKGVFRLDDNNGSWDVYWHQATAKFNSGVWNPTTSRDDMAEVEARLTDAQWAEYTVHLHDERDNADTSYTRWLLTASPLVRAVCLCLALGVKI